MLITHVYVECNQITRVWERVRIFFATGDDVITPVHRRSFQPPIRDHTLKRRFVRHVIFHYMEVRGKLVSRAVNLVKNLGLPSLWRAFEYVENLPRKTTSAGSTPGHDDWHGYDI